MSQSLRIKKREGSTLVPVQRIRYAESFGRKVVLHLGGSRLEYYERIGELEKKLGQLFFRVHRSYLVNLSDVLSYTRENITLKCGDTVLMSKYKYAEFVRAYTNFTHSVVY